MNETKIACACHNVTYAAVRQAVQNGAATADAVMAATGAGTACGKCREFLAFLARDYAEEAAEKKDT